MSSLPAVISTKVNDLYFRPKKPAPAARPAPAFSIVNFSTRTDKTRDARISQLVVQRETLIRNLVTIFGTRDIDPYEVLKGGSGGDYLRHKTLETQATEIVKNQFQWPAEYSLKRTEKFKTILLDEIERWHDERFSRFTSTIMANQDALNITVDPTVIDTTLLRREFKSAVLDQVRQSMRDSINAMDTIVLEFTTDELADEQRILADYNQRYKNDYHKRRAMPTFLVDLVNYYTNVSPIKKGNTIVRYLELFRSDLDIVERHVINDYSAQLQRVSDSTPIINKLVDEMMLETDTARASEARRELIFQYLLYANGTFPERYVNRIQELLSDSDPEQVTYAQTLITRNEAVRNLLFGAQLAASPRITVQNLNANDAKHGEDKQEQYVDTRRHSRFATLFTQYSAARRVGTSQPHSDDSFIVRPFTKIPGFRVAGRPLDQESLAQQALAQSLERSDLQGTLFSMADVLMIRRRLLYDIEIIEDELESLITTKERSGAKQSSIVRLTGADFNGGEKAYVNIPIAIEVLDETKLNTFSFFRARYYWNSIDQQSQIFQHAFQYVPNSGTMVDATRVPIPRESGYLRIVITLGELTGAAFVEDPATPPVHLPTVTFVVQGMCVRCREVITFGTIPEGGGSTPCEWHVNTSMFIDNQKALQINEKYYRIDGILDEFVSQLFQYLSSKYIDEITREVQELNEAIATGDPSAPTKDYDLQITRVPNLNNTIQTSWKISLFNGAVINNGTSNVLTHNLSPSLIMKNFTHFLSYAQLLTLIETFFTGVGRGGDPFTTVVDTLAVKPYSDADDNLIQHIVATTRRLSENFESYVADLSLITRNDASKRGPMRLGLDLGRFTIATSDKSRVSKSFGDDLINDIETIQSTTYNTLVERFHRVGDRNRALSTMPIVTSRRQTFESIESSEDVFIPTREQSSSFKNMQQHIAKKRRRPNNFLVDEQGLEERETHMYSPAEIFGQTTATAYIGPHSSRSMLPTLYRFEIARYAKTDESRESNNIVSIAFSTTFESRYQQAFSFAAEFKEDLRLTSGDVLRILDVYQKDQSKNDYDGIESFDIGLVSPLNAIRQRWNVSLYIPSNVRKYVIQQINRFTNQLATKFTEFRSIDLLYFNAAHFEQLATQVNYINNNLVLTPGTKSSTRITPLK